MFITPQDLVDKRACREGQADVFDAEWSEGVEVTWESLQRMAELGLDLDWGADKFLTSTQWEAYEKARASHWEAYEKAEAPHREAYEKAIAPHREAYEKAEAPHREAYEKAEASHWEAYELSLIHISEPTRPY